MIGNVCIKDKDNILADLGRVHLPLDDVEDGDVAILVGPTQILLNTSAYLAILGYCPHILVNQPNV